MHYSPPSVLLLCIYTMYNLFAHSSCTFLFILLFIKSTVYCPVLHILFYCTFYLIYIFFILILNFWLFSYLYLCIFSCVCVTYNCTVHGAGLTYISLLIIFCIIVCVWRIQILNIDVMHSRWWDLQSLCNLTSRNVVFKVFQNIFTHSFTDWRASAHLYFWETASLRHTFYS